MLAPNQNGIFDYWFFEFFKIGKGSVYSLNFTGIRRASSFAGSPEGLSF